MSKSKLNLCQKKFNHQKIKIFEGTHFKFRRIYKITTPSLSMIYKITNFGGFGGTHVFPLILEGSLNSLIPLSRPCKETGAAIEPLKTFSRSSLCLIPVKKSELWLNSSKLSLAHPSRLCVRWRSWSRLNSSKPSHSSHSSLCCVDKQELTPLIR